MSRELTPQEIAERSLIKTYRKQLWNPFIAAVKRYELVSPGDRIAYLLPVHAPVHPPQDSCGNEERYQDFGYRTYILFHLSFMHVEFLGRKIHFFDLNQPFFGYFCLSLRKITNKN